MNRIQVIEQLPEVPPEAPLAMPVQDLRQLPQDAGPTQRHPDGAGRRICTIAARLFAFGGAVAAAVVGFQQMLAAFGENPSPLQIALLILFTPTFGWIAFSFFGMISGIFATVPKSAAADADDRLVVVMPVYHEDPAASLGALVALAEELAQTPLAGRTEMFVLSDSRLPELVLAERLAVQQARKISPLPIFYRNREQNTEHKSGNVAEFVRRWGARYDQMVVLDADSVMSGQTVATLSARMSGDPAVGLIQTMPMLTGGETIFARLTQFAGGFTAR